MGNNKVSPLEKSLKQLVHRVADCISKEASKQGVINEDSKAFYDDLSFLVMDRRMAFNSPVWFNIGLYNQYGTRENRNPGEEPSHWAINKNGNIIPIDAYERPQGSACFIQSIYDDMASILGHVKKEGMLFKYGSGTGTNFSTLRGINEPLSGGGVASGQISFMRIFDIGAGRIQSGGKTRRAAKMVITDDNHPDLLRFIWWKVNEEKKALWLSAFPEWGARDKYDLDSEAYKTVDGQNGNNTIRLSDEFMEAALNDKDWDLKFITGSRINEEKEITLKEYQDDRYLPDRRFIKRITNKRKTISAKNTLELIARATYAVGDPGLQFHDTINRWHTCPNSGQIRASNPCSEFMSIDDTACNLASINVTKYDNEEKFDTKSFTKTVDLTIRAQDTLVDFCSYPSPEIAWNSHLLRPLGLGYANIGALLMSRGIPYDSDEGRAFAAAITSLMTAKAYETSADLAENLGAFEEFKKNKEPMLNVLKMHRDYSQKIQNSEKVKGLEEVIKEANITWDRAITKGKKQGFRNSQVTLLAPTGTIGFMMGVDSTGIESLAGLATSKGLAGGGFLDLTYECVNKGLRSLGYAEEQIKDIHNYITKKDEKGNFIHSEITEHTPHVKKEHRNIFATSLGNNTISVDGHLKMMAAVQPFLSGAISKTVNLPKGSTIDDVKETYIKAWKLGIKAVAPYVDGSKGIQPMTVGQKKRKEELKWGERKKLNGSIDMFRYQVKIHGKNGNNTVHFIIGEYIDRSPKDSVGDFWVEFGSAGSPYSADLTSWAKEASRSRQRGASLEEFIKHNRGSTDPINGFTSHPFIKTCNGIQDFFAKLVQLEYLGDISVCDNKPNSEQIENLRCNVLAKRRRVEHFRSRIKFIDNIMNKGEISEIYPLYEDELKEGEISATNIFCVNCGAVTVLSGANCRKCPNCGDSSGCG